MHDLLTQPLWRAEDLGKPIPDSDHAVSVAMPLWAHAVGYEEGDPQVIDKLACGYPRFVYHPRIVELMAVCADRFAGAGEVCLPLPCRSAAEAACDYIERKGAGPARVEPFGVHDIHVVVAPGGAAAQIKAYWQHVGRTVSSRLAQSAINDGPGDDGSGAASKIELCDRLAAIYDVDPEDVYLFPTGMAAVTLAHELGAALAPGRPSVQFGFPYVDVLKVQEEFGVGAQFYPHENAASLAELRAYLDGHAIASIVTETPGNPLLETPDIPELAALAHQAGALLIVDDTVATGLNIDLKPHADLIATSLNKNFAGHGDVMGGAMIISPNGAQAAALRDQAARAFEDLLWWEDAVILDRRSADFGERMAAINSNTLQIARFLADHPAVDRVYYPGLGPDPNYEAIRRPDGGYGGLLSFLPVDYAARSANVYDRMRVNKGPSLGTDYTLVCPYTILAHYHELEWAESCGVSRWLIRVSIGLENSADLMARFDEALSAH
jgi:cystathionine gamma-synthase